MSKTQKSWIQKQYAFSGISKKKKIRKSLNTKKKVLKLEMPARKSFCSCKGCLKIKAIANKNSVWQEDKTMENQNSAIHN